MKRTKYISLLVGLTIMMCVSSCNEDEHSSFPTNENTFIIGINLEVETPLTKGVTKDGAFNSSYEENYIYLHKKLGNNVDDNGLQIPIYEFDCKNPNDPITCKGFRIQVTRNVDGTYTLNAIDENDNVIENNSLTVSSSDNFYFSSIENRYWEIEDENITEFEAPQTTPTTQNKLYKRTQELNKEIYRSVEDYTWNELQSLSGQLDMERKCSGFSFLALFDKGTPNQWGSYNLSPDEFMTIMGDSPTNWYVKIYIGNMFTAKYDMQEEDGTQSAGGFYGSTDSEKFTTQGIDDGIYLPFKWDIHYGSSIGSSEGNSSITGIGYQSMDNNLLFAPTNSENAENLTIFIFIKHWSQTDDPSGSEGNPSTEWLRSNEGAMYTQVTGQQVIDITVQDGIFYECGTIIDIEELKAAAIANGLITGTATTNKITTRNASNAPQKITFKSMTSYINY